MALHIDYYASLNSPWTHLGAARIEALAAKYGATLRIWPVDFGTIFPASGGLPLPKRAPQRQAYRLMELRRWRDFLGMPDQHPAEALPLQRGAVRRLRHRAARDPGRRTGDQAGASRAEGGVAGRTEPRRSGNAGHADRRRSASTPMR